MTNGKTATQDAALAEQAAEEKECLISKAAPSTEGNSSNAPTEVFDGVLYRVPALKRVQIEDCPDGKFRKRNIPTSANIVSLPQLGTKARFPLKNKAFDDNDLTAQFHEDGSLVRFSFGARSPAESATTGFAEASGTILDFARRRDAARRAVDTAAATAATAAADNQLSSLDKQLQILSSLSQLQGGTTSSTLNQEIV